MKIVKKENGNTLLTDASGNTIKRFPEGAVIELDKDREGEFVRIAYGHQNKHDIYPSTITHTQIEPNAEVAFSGDAQDLLNLLSTSFFFEVVGGLNIDNYYLKTQYHALTWTGETLTNVVATPIDTLYTRKIIVVKDIEVNEFAIGITTAVAGNAVAGVYDLDDNGFPNNLLFQTNGEFDLGQLGEQSVSLASNYKLKAGAYAVSFLASSSATIRCLVRPNPTWGINKTSSGGSASWIATALTYTNTLPSAHPASSVSGGTVQAAAVLFSIV